MTFSQFSRGCSKHIDPAIVGATCRNQFVPSFISSKHLFYMYKNKFSVVGSASPRSGSFRQIARTNPHLNAVPVVNRVRRQNYFLLQVLSERQSKSLYRWRFHVRSRSTKTKGELSNGIQLLVWFVYRFHGQSNNRVPYSNVLMKKFAE